MDISSAPLAIKDLFKAALLVREKAHSPYSGFKVGAAIRTAQGQTFTGCNVENSSYGGSNCAERVAIQKAVSETENLEIVEIMVVTDANPPWPPCGLCRQVMVEFGTQIKIYCSSTQGAYAEYTLNELLPNAFTPSNLKK
ncbi:MAG: cytidine deaminase [Bdellovibrio sp.]|nr:cytidine deaminase [Bdellovibrio sp.]